MRKIHWLALGALAAKLCAKQGGAFHETSTESYDCILLTGIFSDRQLNVARRLCQSAYKGDFDGIGGNSRYICAGIPPS
jgi:hypothetical protein